MLHLGLALIDGSLGQRELSFGDLFTLKLINACLARVVLLTAQVLGAVKQFRVGLHLFV